MKFRTTATLLCLALFCVGFLGKKKAGNPISAERADHIAGSYVGAIESGKKNRYLDALTTFYLTENGDLEGKYLVADPKGQYEGKLTELNEGKHERIQMVWSDKYGSGHLSVRFSANYESFQGEWKTSSLLTAGGSWTGTKNHNPGDDNSE